MSTSGGHPAWLDRLAGLFRSLRLRGDASAPPLDGPGSGAGKRALRETIERKRRNDLARRLELDRLRLTLRQAPRPSGAETAEPSAFEHSSLLPDLQAQSRTIEKIDAVEADLSRQWWKGRVGGGAVAPRRAALSMAVAGPGPEPGDRAYATTQLIHPGQSIDPGAGPTSTAFAVTQMAGASTGLQSWPDADLPHREAAALPVGSLAGPQVMPRASLASDPWALPVDAVLEEASLRFANGDDAGAQTCLAAALTGEVASPGDPRWGLALLDLFRLTGQQALFDAALRNPTQRLPGDAPLWFSVPDQLALSPSEGPAPDAGGQTAASAVAWTCPPLLNAVAVAQMQAALTLAAPPWRLDWDQLETIAADGVTPLQAVFAEWCEQALVLHFHAAEVLETALRALTPSGDPSLPLAGWQLRLAALRLFGQRDEFELAALDCGVTHGVAPPLWAAARCQTSHLGRTDRPPLRRAGATSVSQAAAPGAALALSGELRGDRSATLAALVPAPAGLGPLVVSCARLVRVDFSAAGRLLTWTSACREAGRKVRFDDLPPLVAAFFQVIGIDEHAELAVRRR
jgi:ABC-type transporter Mla MlaB component